MLGRKELSWRHSPLSELARLAWPICVSMLSYSAMTVADTAFVGAIGPAALAGVGLAGTLAFAVLVFGIGLLRGVKVVVSQAVGAGKEHRVEEVAAAGLIIALAMGFAVVLLAQLVVLVVPMLAASEQAGIYGADYFRVRLWAAPLVYVFCTTRETSYGLGNSRAPMVASLLANVVNIVLDYEFIVNLGLGRAVLPGRRSWRWRSKRGFSCGSPMPRRAGSAQRYALAGRRVPCRLADRGRVHGGSRRVYAAHASWWPRRPKHKWRDTRWPAAWSTSRSCPNGDLEAASVLAGQAVGVIATTLSELPALDASGVAVARAAPHAGTGSGAPSIADSGDDQAGERGDNTERTRVGASELGNAFNITAWGMLRGTR